MRKVRAKMQFTARNTRTYGSSGGYVENSLIFETRYDDTIAEDQRFQAATPTGTIKMVIDNPSALEFFNAGEEYYVDFIKVKDEQECEPTT